MVIGSLYSKIIIISVLNESNAKKDVPIAHMVPLPILCCIGMLQNHKLDTQLAEDYHIPIRVLSHKNLRQGSKMCEIAS